VSIPAKQYTLFFVALGVFLSAANLFAAETEPSDDLSDLQGNQGIAVRTYGAEELMQSEAIRCFVLHKYEEALTEFKVLAAQHPDEVIIRRYIGACLDQLRRDDEALIVLDGILAVSPEDLPTYKLLSKVHLRRGEYAKARERLMKLVELDASGAFSSYAKIQLARLETIESAQDASQGPAGRQMSPEEFLKTKAAVHFMDAHYEEAVTELGLLESQYPEDVRVKRYKGIALDKLGRHEEAIAAFKEGLKLAPENVALHYALAQTLFHSKDLKGSQTELRYVSESIISSDYKMKADRDLEAIETIETVMRRAEGKKWSFLIEQGFEFNSNAASEPTKLQVPDEEHAVRWPGSLYASYQIEKNGPWALSAAYGYSHSFYSDTLDYLQTLVHAPAITLSYLGELAHKPVLTMFSSGYVHVSVADEFYYQSYPQTIRLISSWWDWHRIIFSERIAYTDYKDQGPVPAVTSRESTSNAVNVTNNFYLNQKKDLYLGVGYEFKAEDTEGSDYVRNTHQMNADFNFPLWFDWNGLASFRYKNSDYLETTSNIQRQDDEYLVGARVIVPVTMNTSLKFSYDYLNNDSNDPVYNYVNHSGGVSVVCNF